MKCDIIKNATLGEQYYRYKHKSGLTVLLYPMQGFTTSYAVFGTKYGSIDTTFRVDSNEFTTVPEGIAHFLEHKLFESEDGDAFTLFAKTGASANAYTSFEKTCYLFSTTDNFLESLEALMTFVQAPYFTKETVDKEQGIIGQEIKMYEDDPNWRVFFNLLGALYHNNPVKIDIAGTTESISKIDKDLLYKCYNTFYNLNNMVVSIAGNFSVDEAIKVIERTLKESTPIEIETKTPDEPIGVVKKEVRQKLEVSQPMFNMGYKETPVLAIDELKTAIILEIILSVIMGKGSKLYRDMYDSGLINSTFGKEVFIGRGFLANIIAGESRDPLKVKESVNIAIQEYKEKGISIEEFERVRRSVYGQSIRDFNDVDEMANEMVSAYFSGNCIFDDLDIVANLKVEDVNEMLQKSFNEECLSISIIEKIS